MGNPQSGEYTIEIGDAPYVLKFSHNRIAELEDLLDGRSAIGIVIEGQKLVGSKFVRAALFVCLRHQIKGLTLAKVGVLMDENPEKFVRWMFAVVQAVGYALRGKGFDKELDAAESSLAPASEADGEGPTMTVPSESPALTGESFS